MQCDIYLLVDVLKRSISVLAIANPMASHARLAGVLLALDQHRGRFEEEEEIVEIEIEKLMAPGDRKWSARRTTRNERPSG